MSSIMVFEQKIASLMFEVAPVSQRKNLFWPTETRTGFPVLNLISFTHFQLILFAIISFKSSFKIPLSTSTSCHSLWFRAEGFLSKINKFWHKKRKQNAFLSKCLFYFLTLSISDPSLVSTRIVSPILTKIGTFKTCPVCNVAGFVTCFDVSPCMPGSQSMISSSTNVGG